MQISRRGSPHGSAGPQDPDPKFPARTRHPYWVGPEPRRTKNTDMLAWWWWCRFSNPVSITRTLSLVVSRDSHVSATDVFSRTCPISDRCLAAFIGTRSSPHGDENSGRTRRDAGCFTAPSTVATLPNDLFALCRACKAGLPSPTVTSSHPRRSVLKAMSVGAPWSVWEEF